MAKVEVEADVAAAKAEEVEVKEELAKAEVKAEVAV